jgi:glycosyltransferase involved in cell wall biosynthesis
MSIHVAVSNGFNRFHLAVAAAEAGRRGQLTEFITGAYPTRRLRATLRLASRIERVRRLLDREETVEGAPIVALSRAEALYEAGRILRSDHIVASSLRLYGKTAARTLENSCAEVFHYRSGFGNASAEVARERGIVTLCDHSIVHPHALRRLAGDVPAQLAGLWATVLADVDAADHVVVNSDFVRSTFLEEGWDPGRVHVVYWGVDDGFFRSIPVRPRSSHPHVRLLFAGSFEHRKGSDVLADALVACRDLPWQLDLVGPVVDEAATARLVKLGGKRVRIVGTTPRSALASLMAAADVFVFPSRAEGSARVVFEALAAGCFVITTANTGSIVQHGVHGALVSAGDAAGLADAIRTVCDDREGVAAAGAENAQLIASRYRQRDYGDALAALYRKVHQ